MYCQILIIWIIYPSRKKIVCIVMNQMRKTIFQFLILFLSDLLIFIICFFICRICKFSTLLFGDQKYTFSWLQLWCRFCQFILLSYYIDMSTRILLKLLQFLCTNKMHFQTCILDLSFLRCLCKYFVMCNAL